jgi:hypothetical protein
VGRQVQALERLVNITAATQAERFDALLTLQEQSGAPLTYQDSVELMAKRGIVLSRSVWHKLRDPKYLIKNFNVLAGFADIFGIDGEYLLSEDAPIPAAIEAQRETLAAARAASVMEYATRRMGFVQFSAEDMQSFRDLLMKYSVPAS